MLSKRWRRWGNLDLFFECISICGAMSGWCKLTDMNAMSWFTVGDFLVVSVIGGVKEIGWASRCIGDSVLCGASGI